MKSTHALSEVVRQANIKTCLIQILTCYADLANKSENIKTIDKIESIIQKIIKYLDMHYMDNVTLDIIESEFFLNRYYIAHTFKEITGYTVIEYLQYRRIIEAQKQLRETQREIVEICYDCGFNNIQHFCRVFKKIARTTPFKYRVALK